MSYIHLIYPLKKMDNECQFMSHPFKSRKYVQKDEFGNCVLGLPHPVLLEIVNLGEECGAHPSLSVKVVAMKEEDGYDSSKLQVYFSEDYGDTYYNEGNPHVATPRRDRMLLDKKGSDDEDEVKDYTVSSLSQQHLVEDRELLTFHEKTQRKLCCSHSDRVCWQYKIVRVPQNKYCYTLQGEVKVPLILGDGTWGMLSGASTSCKCDSENPCDDKDFITI